MVSENLNDLGEKESRNERLDVLPFSLASGDWSGVGGGAKVGAGLGGGMDILFEGVLLIVLRRIAFRAFKRD